MRAGGRRATRRGRSVEGLAERLEPRVLLAAQLVRDVNTTPGTVSFLGNITPVGSVAYFMEHDGADGVELWSTDGTASGTQLIKDINPGPGGSYPGGFTTIFGITYFAATDGTSGSELWRTDGTADGTWRVKDINPGRADSNPGDFAVSGSMLYFFADDGVHGRELWRSDGTEDGTVLVADIRPGATGQSVTNLRRMVATSSGALVFYANNGTSTGVYTSDGEVGNYTLLKVPSTPPASSLIASGNYAYFADSLGYVWGSDGTAAGTIAIDSTNSLANQFLDANGVLFYVRGSNLVRRIDGTSVTSVSGSYRNASSLINVDGTVYFGATDFVTGHPQLWTCPAFTSSGSMVTNNVSVVGGRG